MSSRFFARKVIGNHFVAYDQPQAFGVWPNGTTTGPAATAVLLKPAKDVFFTIDAAYDTVNSGKLPSGESHVIHLHPLAQTIFIADAQSDSGAVTMNWLIP